MDNNTLDAIEQCLIVHHQVDKPFDVKYFTYHNSKDYSVYYSHSLSLARTHIVLSRKEIFRYLRIQKLKKLNRYV